MGGGAYTQAKRQPRSGTLCRLSVITIPACICEWRASIDASLDALKQTDLDVDDNITMAVRRVGSRMFAHKASVWIDRDFKTTMKVTRVTYGITDYFELLSQHPELKQCFALGTRVIIAVDADNTIIVEAPINQ